MIPHHLGCNQFARRLIKFKRKILLIRLSVYYKRIQPRNSQMESTHRARYGISVLSPAVSFSPKVFTSLEALQTLSCEGFFMETSSPAGGVGSSNPHLLGSISHQPPTLGRVQSHLINVRYPHCSPHFGHPKGFKSPVTEKEGKTK